MRERPPMPGAPNPIPNETSGAGDPLARLLGGRDFGLEAVRRVSGLYIDSVSLVGTAGPRPSPPQAALTRAVAAFLGDAYVTLCDGRWCAGAEGRDGSRPAVIIGRRARTLRIKVTLLDDLALLRETRDREAVAGWMSLLRRRDEALADALRSTVGESPAQGK